VIRRRALIEFAKVHLDAAEPLDNWYRRTKQASWNNLVDVRTDYPHADLVGRCVFFNVGGNKYRLIVKIKFDRKTVFIRFVLTHREYDKESWKNDCVA
jgi:mRNA interferase HigB